VTEDGDFGVLFMHNEGYSTMCGHGVIAVVTVGIECGLFELRRGPQEIRIDTPAGRVVACATVRGGTVERVSFRNVPSFFVESGKVEIAGLGTVAFDLAFGGAFYAYVDAGEVELRLEPAAYREIVDRGMQIKSAVARAHPLHHPAGEPDLDFLYGTIFVERVASSGALREVCVFADGEVDRSPTGTGVSGLAAILHRRGKLAPETGLTVESLIGTAFEVEVTGTTRVGRYDAVVPRVAGRAFLTGRHEFWVDPADPLREGVLLR
jgi:trans-L-3-hydroxyproline dehydratase